MATHTMPDKGVAAIIDEVKPKLRGWLHAGFTPLALLGGIGLIVFAPTLLGRIGGAVYLLASLALFGTSAAYHRGNWSPKVRAAFRRVDHANIYLFIAATYTPLGLLLLGGGSRVLLLTLVWTAATLGLLFRVFWISAPRWLYTLLYIAMGWAAMGWINQFWAVGGPVVVGLIILGGLIYSFGAIVYARKSPNPSPKWFGFHEVFHLCTILAAGCHYAAISLATYAA